MYRLHQRISKKFVYLIFLAIVCVAGLYFVFSSSDERDEIPTLYPLHTKFKSVAQNQNDSVGNESEKTVYENFVFGSAKKAKVIKLLPDPEVPVLLPNTSEPDAFAVNLEEEKKGLLKDESIWGAVDEESIAKKDDELYAKKALHITNDSTKKTPPLAAKKVSPKAFYAQLGYSRSVKDSSAIWNRLKNNNKKLLQTQQYKILKQKRDNTVIYELLAGPFEDFKEAKHLCRRLKLEKQKCLAVKR